MSGQPIPAPLASLFVHASTKVPKGRDIEIMPEFLHSLTDISTDPYSVAASLQVVPPSQVFPFCIQPLPNLIALKQFNIEGCDSALEKKRLKFLGPHAIHSLTNINTDHFTRVMSSMSSIVEPFTNLFDIHTFITYLRDVTITFPLITGNEFIPQLDGRGPLDILFPPQVFIKDSSHSFINLDPSTSPTISIAAIINHRRDQSIASIARTFTARASILGPNPTIDHLSQANDLLHPAVALPLAQEAVIVRQLANSFIRLTQAQPSPSIAPGVGGKKFTVSTLINNVLLYIYFEAVWAALFRRRSPSEPYSQANRSLALAATDYNVIAYGFKLFQDKASHKQLSFDTIRECFYHLTPISSLLPHSATSHPSQNSSSSSSSTSASSSYHHPSSHAKTSFPKTQTKSYSKDSESKDGQTKDDRTLHRGFSLTGSPEERLFGKPRSQIENVKGWINYNLNKMGNRK